MKKQRGVTMIELMIAMMLGLGLVAGIGQLFVQSQKSFRLQRNVSDMTDDATFALEDFAKGLMTAGYSLTGTNFECETITSTKLDDLTVLSTRTTCNHASGTEQEKMLELADSQNDVLSSGLNLTCNDVTTITDDSKPATATEPAQPATVQFTTVTTKCETIKGTDDKLIYRFKLDETQSHKNNSICIVNSYNAQDIVPVYVLHDNTNKELSCTSKNASQPLIAEVEKLEFRYGIKDKDAGLFYYTKAENITDWTTVFAVKIFLVMRSAEDKLTKNKIKYKIEDQEYTATDNRLYKVFTKTVFLRATNN